MSEQRIQKQNGKHWTNNNGKRKTKNRQTDLDDPDVAVRAGLRARDTRFLSQPFRPVQRAIYAIMSPSGMVNDSFTSNQEEFFFLG